MRLESMRYTYSLIAYRIGVMADSPEALLPVQPTMFHILLSLTDEDRHGYAIILEVARRTNGELKLSAGTLYRSIHRMLELGLITEVKTRPAPELDDERRRYYRITPFGTAVAQAEAGRLRDLLRLARSCGVAPRTA
jgi:DNA-binding PadR family transcriptional regulator